MGSIRKDGRGLKRTLICGWGINDVMEPTEIMINGKRVRDPFYRRWVNLIGRCHDPSYKVRRPTYNDVYCNEEWKYFSNFKRWMQQQLHWEGLQLDKDILVRGNREYGPDKCVFVPNYLNTIMQVQGNKGRYLLGSVKTPEGRWHALCMNNLMGESTHLGSFATEHEAHVEWQKSKIRVFEFCVNRYAKEPWFRTDVAEAMMSRVWALRLQIANGIVTTSLADI